MIIMLENTYQEQYSTLIKMYPAQQAIIQSLQAVKRFQLKSDPSQWNPNPHTFDIDKYLIRPLEKLAYFCSVEEIRNILKIAYARFNEEKIKNFILYLLERLPIQKLSNYAKLEEIWQARNLLPQSTFYPTLNDGIEVHSVWLYEVIFKQNYVNNSPRSIHGILHSCRTGALYITVLANLFRLHGHPDALQLTNTDLKLLQITMFLHDAARLNDGKDEWDLESALMAYYYLTKILHITHDQAKRLAEAIANKDKQRVYYELVLKDGHLSWMKQKKRLSVTIEQMLIHDADCLDIIRAVPLFQGKRLYAYTYLSTLNYSHAIDKLALLIRETVKLLFLQGDEYNQQNRRKKSFYDDVNCYLKLFTLLNDREFPLLCKLNANGFLLSSSALQAINFNELVSFNKDPASQYLQQAMNEGKIFIRAIFEPTSISSKRGMTETKLAKEIRKILRKKKGIASIEKQKSGNPCRSVTMIGWGSGTFYDSGYFILNPKIKYVRHISTIDCDSGYAKKEYFERKPLPSLLPYEKQKKLLEVQAEHKMGGVSRKFDVDCHADYNEIIYDVHFYSGVFFTREYCFMNSYERRHKNSSLLRAVYILNELTLKEGKALPLVEYSAKENFIRLFPRPTDDELVVLWTELCSDFIKDTLGRGYWNNIFQLSLENIKIFSLHGCKNNTISADSNYPEELQERINQSIVEARQKLFNIHLEQMNQKLSTKQIDVLNTIDFFNIIYYPSLCSNHQYFIVDCLKRTTYNYQKELDSIKLVFNGSILKTILAFPCHLLKLNPNQHFLKKEFFVIFNLDIAKIYLYAHSFHLRSMCREIEIKVINYLRVRFSTILNEIIHSRSKDYLAQLKNKLDNLLYIAIIFNSTKKFFHLLSVELTSLVRRNYSSDMVSVYLHCKEKYGLELSEAKRTLVCQFLIEHAKTIRDSDQANLNVILLIECCKQLGVFDLLRDEIFNTLDVVVRNWIITIKADYHSLDRFGSYLELIDTCHEVSFLSEEIKASLIDRLEILNKQILDGAYSDFNLDDITIITLFFKCLTLLIKYRTRIWKPMEATWIQWLTEKSINYKADANRCPNIQSIFFEDFTQNKGVRKRRVIAPVAHLPNGSTADFLTAVANNQISFSSSLISSLLLSPLAYNKDMLKLAFLLFIRDKSQPILLHISDLLDKMPKGFEFSPSQFNCLQSAIELASAEKKSQIEAYYPCKWQQFLKIIEYIKEYTTKNYIKDFYLPDNIFHTLIEEYIFFRNSEKIEQLRAIMHDLEEKIAFSPQQRSELRSCLLDDIFLKPVIAKSQGTFKRKRSHHSNFEDATNTRTALTVPTSSQSNSVSLAISEFFVSVADLQKNLNADEPDEENRFNDIFGFLM